MKDVLQLKKEDNHNFFYYIIHLVWMILLLAITCGVLLLYTVTHSHASQITHCYDGDTCYLKGEHKLRIGYINTPEIRGDCQRESTLAILARDNLNKLVKNANKVTVKVYDVDKYGRLVGNVYIDGKNYTSLVWDEPWYSLNKKNWCK